LALNNKSHAGLPAKSTCVSSLPAFGKATAFQRLRILTRGELVNELIQQIFVALKSGLQDFAIVSIPIAIAGTFAEFLIIGEKQSLFSRFKGLMFLNVYVVVSTLLVTPFEFAFQLLHIKPLFTVDLSKAASSHHIVVLIAAYTVLPYTGLWILDFFYYWFHRVQHVFKPFWRVHSVHHSIEELNIFNSFHHVLEPILQVPLVFIPMNLLMSVSLPQIIALSVLVRFTHEMIHANTRISYGPLKYLIAEPRYHRIHHSVECQHFDKNFASVFPVWDIIFGTAYFPKPEEYPKTGLSTQREPKTIAQYLFEPFRRKRAVDFLRP
jgi:sterol desaturase/sphingolipid hydroxylase (fatty acid hydroxylase superfamily)